jgi:hypothetical protein
VRDWGIYYFEKYEEAKAEIKHLKAELAALSEWEEQEREQAMQLWAELRDAGRDDDFPATVIDALTLLRSFWRLRNQVAEEVA